MIKKNIIKVIYFLMILLLIIPFYLTYVQLAHGSFLREHRLNKRHFGENEVKRGNIYAAGNELLVTTTTDGREYPGGAAFGSVIGYMSPRFGQVGLEAAANDYLSGNAGFRRYINWYRRALKQEGTGYDVYLTLDAGLQQTAYRLMDGRRGAAVALDPRTGAVLALVSSPGFNPNYLEEEWSQLIQSEDSCLLNRATEGLYPPGSVFKIITAAAVLEKNPDYWDKKDHYCEGYLMVNGQRLGDLNAHGSVNLSRALQVSCNTFFACIALELGAEDFYTGVKRFCFGEKLPFELPVKNSSFPEVEKLNDNALAECSIGQGQVLVTPLQMALATAAVANKGVIMQPYLIQEVLDKEGKNIYIHRSKVWARPITPRTAGLVSEALTEAVRRGTATGAAMEGVAVAGKTGSAQNPHGETHAWFVSFAPAASPEIVVVVVLENAGQGGKVAAPIVKAIMEQALN